MLGDPHRILQILYFLIFNALKHTYDGKITIFVRSFISNKMTFLKFSVVDTGYGMSEDKVNSLFSLFQNLNFVKGINQSGIGLGLSICKKIIDLFKGSIFCTSKLNKGSIFSFTIPSQIVQIPMGQDDSCLTPKMNEIVTLKYQENSFNFNPKSINFLETKYRTEEPTQRNFKILIVDDDSFNLYALTQIILKDNNHSIQYAQNGEIAI